MEVPVEFFEGVPIRSLLSARGRMRLPANLAQWRSPNPRRLSGKPPFTHEIVLLAHLGSAASRPRPSVSGTHRSPPGPSPPGLDAGDE
jgi:hypothetical protein